MWIFLKNTLCSHFLFFFFPLILTTQPCSHVVMPCNISCLAFCPHQKWRGHLKLQEAFCLVVSYLCFLSRLLLGKADITVVGQSNIYSTGTWPNPYWNCRSQLTVSDLQINKEARLLTREGQQKQASEKGKCLHRKRMGVVNSQMLGTQYGYQMLATKPHNCVASTEKQCVEKTKQPLPFCSQSIKCWQTHFIIQVIKLAESL